MPACLNSLALVRTMRRETKLIIQGTKLVRILVKAVGVAAALSLSTPAFAGWEPTKPVEIVVAAGAGGASDQMARMMQAAIQKNNLMKQPMVVSLKGGASGAEALMYMKSSDGDANKVLIAYSLIYMLPLSAKIPFNWRDLTPVSVVALDQFVLWDNAEGPKTVKDFIAAAKAAGSPFKMGGTGSKREDHVLTVFGPSALSHSTNWSSATTETGVRSRQLKGIFADSGSI